MLALQHRQIPPSLHFEPPNPQIDFAGSPFYVNTALRRLAGAAAAPRRAGVSSFGIGGTNAHVVLEEAPAAEPAGARARPGSSWSLSARTAGGAGGGDATTWPAHLRAPSRSSTWPTSPTPCRSGRRAFAHRRGAGLPRRAEDAARRSRRATRERVLHRRAGERREPAGRLPVPRPGRAVRRAWRASLYDAEPVFRARGRPLRRAAARRTSGSTCAQLLFPAPADEAAAARRLRADRRSPSRPCSSSSTPWPGSGWPGACSPQAMLGHSLGEYVAACLAGVFSLEDALALVAARGRLMQALPAGRHARRAAARGRGARRCSASELSLAAVNGPALLRGRRARRRRSTALARAARRRGASRRRRLHTSHAFHSADDGPDRSAPFARAVRGGARSRAPRIPFVSNVTGTWITAEEATDPGYWARHLRAAGALRRRRSRRCCAEPDAAAAGGRARAAP